MATHERYAVLHSACTLIARSHLQLRQRTANERNTLLERLDGA
jgi:hypothetical protein